MGFRFALALVFFVAVSAFGVEREPVREPIRKKVSLPKSGAGSAKGKCATNPCPAGQECVLIEVHCVSAPCPPMQECVDSK